MKIGPYETHPLADIFPLVEGEEFKDLERDVCEHGFAEKVIDLLDGKILDGRNRTRIAENLGRIGELDFRELPPETDPVQRVISKNLHRRHLKTGQRAIIAARLSLNLDGAEAADRAAYVSGVSRGTVYHALTVLQSGNEDLIRQVEAGKIAVSAAAERVCPATKMLKAQRRRDRAWSRASSSPAVATPPQLGTNASSTAVEPERLAPDADGRAREETCGAREETVGIRITIRRETWAQQEAALRAALEPFALHPEVQIEWPVPGSGREE